MNASIQQKFPDYILYSIMLPDIGERVSSLPLALEVYQHYPFHNKVNSERMVQYRTLL
jgi:hypothetical protein